MAAKRGTRAGESHGQNESDSLRGSRQNESDSRRGSRQRESDSRRGTRQRELDEAWELMHFALRAVIAVPDRMLEKRGLSRLHHRILFFVAREPEMTVSRLLQVLGVSKQALNAPLRQLTTQRMVASSAAEHDKRQKLLALTDEGRALEQRLTEPQRKLFDTALTAAGPRADAAWRRVMRAMADDEMKRSGRG